jgi:hypothetical protein
VGLLPKLHGDTGKTIVSFKLWPYFYTKLKPSENIFVVRDSINQFFTTADFVVSIHPLRRAIRFYGNGGHIAVVNY